jgi:hypothetical protein
MKGRSSSIASQIMFLLLLGNVLDMLFDLFLNYFDMMKRYGLVTFLITK